MNTKKSIFQIISAYIKGNKSSLLVPAVALAGYILLVVFLFITEKAEQTPLYLPSLPMFTGLAINLFSLMFFYDCFSTFLTQKGSGMSYILYSPKQHNEYSAQVNPSITPLLSIIYRIFNYAGIFILLAIGGLKLLRYDFSQLNLISFLISGVFIAILYETFRAGAYVLSVLLSRFLDKKKSLLIIRFVFIIAVLYLLTMFVYRSIISADLFAGLGELSTLGFWDIFILSRWTFDIVYLALGYNFGNLIITIFITFAVSEVVLHAVLFFSYNTLSQGVTEIENERGSTDE